MHLWSKRWLIALATAVPLAWALLLASHSGRIPHHDYWDMQEEFFSAEGFSGRASDWLTANRLGDLYMVDVNCDPDVQPFYDRLDFLNATAMIRRNYGVQRGVAHKPGRG